MALMPPYPLPPNRVRPPRRPSQRARMTASDHAALMRFVGKIANELAAEIPSGSLDTLDAVAWRELIWADLLFYRAALLERNKG